MDKMRQKKRELQNKYNETKLEDCDSNNELMEPVSNSFFFVVISFSRQLIQSKI